MANPEPLNVSSETEYIFRFEGEGEPLPPTAPDLFVPAQQQRQEPQEAGQKDCLAVYSSLVHAAITGELTPEMAKKGVKPSPQTLRHHTRLSSSRIRNTLSQLPPDMLCQAVTRAGEIDMPPFLPWSPELEARRKQVTAERFAEAQEPTTDDGHIAWEDVQERHRDTFFMGTLPRMKQEGPLDEDQRIELQSKLVDLPGLPRVKDVDTFQGLLAELPRRTPSLCIVADSEIIAVRSGQEITDIPSLQREHLLLLNLYLIRGLAGAAGVSHAQMVERTGYPRKKFDRQFTGLLGILDGSGILVRTRSGKLNPHYGLAASSMVVDARPLPSATE